MFRVAACFLLGILAFALGADLLLRLLPVSTATQYGYYIDPMISTPPPHHQWDVATGWDLRNTQSLRANNFGFVADRDFTRDERAVALIGDSFVEASMLDPRDRPGARLQRALPARPVYAMGAPGTSLLDYAERIRFAHEKWGVKDFVILMERFDVQQSFCGSGNISGPCVERGTLAPSQQLQAPPGPVKQVLRHSALAQYVFGQIKLDPGRLWRQMVNQARPEAGPKSGATTSQPATVSDEKLRALAFVTDTFFKRIEPYRGGRLVIVLDSDRHAIYGGDSGTDRARNQFIEMARAAGAIVVDTAPLFREQMARAELKLDVGPYDSHLNPLGIRITMDAAARALMAD